MRDLQTTAFAALILTSGFAIGGCQAVMTAQALNEYPPPGTMVDVGGGRRMQIDCRGSGSPTVVFEAGGNTAGSLDWAPIQAEVAGFTRACSYSRAGLMWSDAPVGVYVDDEAARDLHALLAGAGESAPLVLVGYSRGGLFTLIYTGEYGEDVAGLVLVDSSHPEQEQRFAAAGLPRDDGELSLTQKAGVALGWTGVLRIAAPSVAGDYPPEIAEQVNALFPKSTTAAIREAQALPEISAAAGADRDLGDRPVMVLTRQLPASIPLPQDGRLHEDEWRRMHEDLATWSSQGELRVVPDSDHTFYVSRPDEVIAAIRDVVEAVRE